MSASNSSLGALSILNLPGVGKQIAKHLAKLDVHCVADLLFHFPSRYQDRTHLRAIRQITPGEEAVIEGVVTAISHPLRGRTKLLLAVEDASGTIYLRFFHLLRFQQAQLKTGVRLRCYSHARLGAMGLEMVHPEFQLIRAGRSAPIDPHLTPIYPATEGLSQYYLRKLTTHALGWMQSSQTFPELLPDVLLQQFALPRLKQALQFVHRPPAGTSMQALLENETAQQRRLVFEELLAHRISLLHVKQVFQSQAGVSLTKEGTLTQQFLTALPFELTQAQQRVSEEIRLDLLKPYPMLRLVQGDVGSGKTVVAALAMLKAVDNGFQAAMMAPTELLAEQHYHVFQRWFESLGVKVAYLSGSVKGQKRTIALKAMAEGETQIILGTHALFQADVYFSRLALVVIDEQHRFGVEQRALFREKGMQTRYYPHQLVMTATPIPRTLAMSFYADLDCSTLDALPAGRTPVTTIVMAASRRDEVMARVREACQQGRQVYWVCPLIEESEALPCQAATDMAMQLAACLPALRVGLVHGRLRAREKEAVMREFKQGDIQVLVATTVIEVGMDVPNASVMVIENAERLGLSQLHQLRGRVGRGAVASHCVLLYQYPLSNLAKERLAVMREISDGFKISQRDLELRGPGEVLGTRQTGELSFRVADLMRDSALLPAVQEAATVMLREHPDKLEPLIQRWLRDGLSFGKV
ncbi:MAG: ATP-dependent DNA helicase RecG [Gammaproteobacteria bacterium RIFCSPHIGHO2_12_FULL_45_12]|nr:MAG: ATP-dependent DNA helicase RecG [Gammaproteobacteria bacterium RIFCSPHIGHO2_12_FULL_45_12]